MNLYIDSDLEWPEKGMRLRQATSFPEQQAARFTMTTKNPVSLTLNLRIPYWVQGGSVKVNGTKVPAFASPSSYLSLNRTWKTGDEIELSLPMGLHVDRMPDDEAVQAVMYGPLVLAGRFDAVNKDMLYGDFEPRKNAEMKVPDILADPDQPTAWIEQDPKQPLVFRAVGQSRPMTLVPLYQVIKERYAVYWKVTKKSA